jgi:YegS/Rv2252/BmrU family lipid kinase
MKHLFVINPVAGGKDRTEALSKTINEVMPLKAPGEDFEIYVTKAPMDAVRIVKEKAASGEKLRIYACGGDGTLNECANGAAGFSNAALTHFPAGTGNDFIKIFGKGAEKFKNLALLVDGEEKAVDLISCNGRYSLNICSVGIDARIGTDVHKYSGIPVLGGKGGYIISTVVNIIKGINQHFTIKADGEVVEGEFALVCACNGRYYGGYFNPVPEAQPDDGLIDFLIIQKVSRTQFLQLVGKYQSGRYKEMPEVIRHISAKSLILEGENIMKINLDGELAEGITAEFKLEEAKLNFFFPQGISW